MIQDPFDSRARRHTLSSLLVLAVLVPAAHGAAAESLEEVVITAARRPVPALETPLSIGRVGTDAIALTGATHSSQVLNRVPGVNMQRGSGEEGLTAIRSPVLTGAGSCGAFLFLENGVPIRPVGSCNVNEMFEINTEQADAIEVVRGPGSALYGSNALHGTVNVLQAAPAQRPAFGGGVEVGPTDYQRVRLAGRLEEGQADFGVAALYTHDGGWRVASGFDEAKLNAAMTSRWDATPVRVDLAATTLNQQTAGYITGKDAYLNEQLARGNPSAGAFRDAYAVRLTGLIEPPVDFGAKLELRPYLRTSRMEFVQAFLLGQPLERNGQQSGGLISTLAWHANPAWSATAGADLELADSFLYEYQANPTTGGSPVADAIRPAGKHYDYDVRTNMAAVYGQAEYRFAGRWHAGAGARAEYVTYDYDNHMIAGNTDANGVPCPFGGCLYSRPPDRHDSFFNVAPKLALLVDVVDGLTAYVNASRGFRPPETTELYRLQRQQTAANLGSEQLDSLELGLKGALEAVRFSLAAFDMYKRNVILRESNGFNVSNGKTTHRGVEYDLQWDALNTLTLTGSGTYALHRYDFSRAVDGGDTIVKGNDIANAPRELQRIALLWRPVATVSSEAEWRRVGAYWLDAANVHRYTGHELLNLRASWRWAPRWTAALRLNNVLDRLYADRADYAFGNYRYFPGRERSLFVELAWSAERK